MNKIEILIEKLMQHASENSEFAADIKSARGEFFQKAGHFEEDNENFEMKMAQFVDWFLFIRQLSDNEKSPFEKLVDDSSKVFADSIELIDIIKKNVHSLFEFVKLKGTDVYLKDLFTGEKYVIQKSPLIVGFHRDEIFETRIFPWNETFVFSQSFCFHPPQVARYINKEIKLIRKLKDEGDKRIAKSELIDRLFKMKYKHEQYKHLAVEKIYSNQTELRI